MIGPIGPVSSSRAVQAARFGRAVGLRHAWPMNRTSVHTNRPRSARSGHAPMNRARSAAVTDDIDAKPAAPNASTNANCDWTRTSTGTPHMTARAGFERMDRIGPGGESSPPSASVAGGLAQQCAGRLLQDSPPGARLLALGGEV